MSKHDKAATTFRLSALARAILPRIASARGVSMTDVLETMLRDEGERLGIVTRVNGALVETGELPPLIPLPKPE